MAGRLSTEDVAALQVLAAVELAVAGAHRLAGQTGRLAAEIVVTTDAFAGHHEAHAALLADTLTGGGATPTSGPDVDTAAALTSRISGAPDQTAVLAVLVEVEEALAATHLDAIARVGPAGAAALAQVVGVEAQHAVAIALLLGTAGDHVPPTQDAVLLLPVAPEGGR